jgi:hypothetical protein
MPTMYPIDRAVRARGDASAPLKAKRKNPVVRKMIFPLVGQISVGFRLQFRSTVVVTSIPRSAAWCNGKSTCSSR